MSARDEVRVEEFAAVNQAVAAVETALPAGTPLCPESITELGVGQALLEDLALKILLLNGSLSLTELTARIRLPFVVVNELLRRLRTEFLAEITGIKGNVPQIAISDKGRSRAMELMLLNRYVGPAPVSLDSYIKQVQLQSVRDAEVYPPQVERAFAHLVLKPRTLKKLGAALNSGSSIFLYGPSGTGKTSLATAIPRAFDRDRVCGFRTRSKSTGRSSWFTIPACTSQSISPNLTDARWVLCQRPMVSVGGELTLEMLDLQLNPVARFYTAPLQMKANNGVLIIDDFGRQRMRPEELLNRWVVPLDRRIDFLSLAGGQQIEIPFEMFVVFATNLSPASLVDAAFLRRIQTKIEVGAVSDTQFHEISAGSATSSRWNTGPR